MRIGLYPNPERDTGFISTNYVKSFLEVKGQEVYIWKDHSASFPGCPVFPDAKVDVVISLGGDGTVIYAKNYCLENDVPLLGINLGTIGFLTEISKDEIDDALNRLVKGNYTITEKMLLEVKGFENEPALNDAYLVKTTMGTAAWFNLFIGGDYIGRYKADGFLVSTPTGSTAYALSAGGPIISPKAGCLIVVALNPHSLTLRPIILDDGEVIRIVTNEDTSTIIDGSSKGFAKEITVRKSDKKMKFIEFNRISYYSKLNLKLM